MGFRLIETPDNFGPEAAPGSGPRDMLDCSLDELSGKLEQNAKLLAYHKAEIDLLQTELRRRFGESIARSLAEAGKEHGTVRLPMQDGLTVKADVAKTVKWDSAKLLTLAQTMPWAAVTRVFKVEFSMSETAYAGVAAVAPDLQAKVDAARTVTFGAPKISIEKDA